MLMPALMLIGAALTQACSEPHELQLEGRPGGPYRATLSVSPAPVAPQQQTTLSTSLTRRADNAPLTGLRILHERAVHNFIVALDFSSFAHIHHEDFAPLAADDLAAATFSFPYTFPRAGSYRMVSEFTYRDRSWLKQFEIKVGQPTPPPRVTIDLSQQKRIGDFDARLGSSPAVPVAGFEAELVLELSRGGQPVQDLELILGSEMHVAIWRVDGAHFGHAHSYTPAMAAMMASMHDPSSDPAERAAHNADMMLAMMALPAEPAYPGPRIPFRHVFPAAGTYALFLQCAPAGSPQVFNFMVEVADYTAGMETRIESMVSPAHPHGHGPS